MSEIGQAFSDPEALYTRYNEGGGLTGLSGLPSSPSAQEDTPALELFSDTPLGSSFTVPKLAPRESRNESAKADTVKTPSFGTMALVGLLGGPGAVNSYAERYRASQAGPIIGQLRIGIDKEIQAGNLDKAEQMMAGLSSLAQYSPQAVEEFKNFANRINAKRKDQEQVDVVLKSIDVKTLAKDNLQAALDLRTLGQQGARNPEALKQVLAANELSVTKSGQIVSRSNKLYGTYTEQTVAPNIDAKDYSPEKIAAIQQLGLDPNKIANLENKIARDEPVKPSELQAYNAAFPDLTARIQKNTEMRYIPPAVGVGLNLAPGRAQALTSPSSTDITRTPLPTTQPSTPPAKGGKSPLKPEAFNSRVDVESTIRNIADELKTKSGLSEPESTKRAAELVKENVPGLSDEQKARIDEIAAKGLEETVKTEATNRANYATKPYEVGTGYHLVDGKLITAPPGLSEKELDEGKWHKEAFATDERKQLFAYNQFHSIYEKLLPQVLSSPLFQDSVWEKVHDVIGNYIQKGVTIPVGETGQTVNIRGFAGGLVGNERVKLNAALGVLNQLIEATSNPSNKDNVEIQSIKNILASPVAKIKDIQTVLQVAHDTAQARAEGIIGSTPGAVQNTERTLPTISSPLPKPSSSSQLAPQVKPVNTPPTSQESYGPIPLEEGRPTLPEVSPTRTTPQVGPTSPLGNSPTINPGRQVSGEIPVRTPRTLPGPAPVRAGENIEVLQVPILGKTIETIKKSFKERSNVK